MLFIALPMMLMFAIATKKMMVTTLDMQIDVRRERKELEKLKRELQKGLTHDTRQEAADEK